MPSFKYPTLIIGLLLFLSACNVPNSLTGTTDIDPTVTSSIPKTYTVEGVETTDVEFIKTTVVNSDSANAVAWQNPNTGNKGTITAINTFIGEKGQQCKKFQTTVDTFMGISLYKGETCELRKGSWVLSWLLREGG